MPLNKKQQAMEMLLTALAEDQQILDDKNVDTKALEALIKKQEEERHAFLSKQKTDYLTARNLAYENARGRASL